jgi:hypothetical protein
MDVLCELLKIAGWVVLVVFLLAPAESNKAADQVVMPGGPS